MEALCGVLPPLDASLLRSVADTSLIPEKAFKKARALRVGLLDKSARPKRKRIPQHNSTKSTEFFVRFFVQIAYHEHKEFPPQVALAR